jgi:hypothetical protein
MLPICTFGEIENSLSDAFVQRYAKGATADIRLAGILFARPESPLAKSEIVSSIAYFNQLTADHIDFFCPGYGVGDNDDSEPQDFEWISMGGSGEARYRFSNRAFVSTIREFEKATSLRASGGTDLVLTNAVFDAVSQRGKLDFRSTIFCQLDKMKDDGAIKSVETFFKQIVDYVSSTDGTDPAWGFSDKQGLKSGMSWLKRLVLSLLPKDLGKLYQEASHFAVRDATFKPA